MGGLVMGGLGGFFQAGKIHPPDRRLKEAVLKARALAERESKPVYLSYSTNSGGIFLIEGSKKIKLSLDERNQTSTDQAPEITFSAICENSPFNYTPEQLRLSKVKFFAGCSPDFSARIVSAEGEEQLSFDPFSAYAIKKN